MKAIEYIKRIKDPVIREVMLNDILEHPFATHIVPEECDNIKKAIYSIAWHRTSAGQKWYEAHYYNPPALLTDPTDRERHEALLKEFMGHYRRNTYYSPDDFEDSADPKAITDFLNKKYNTPE